MFISKVFSSIEQYETHRFNESAPEILNLINTMIYLEILIIFLIMIKN